MAYVLTTNGVFNVTQTTCRATATLTDWPGSVTDRGFVFVMHDTPLPAGTKRWESGSWSGATSSWTTPDPVTGLSPGTSYDIAAIASSDNRVTWAYGNIITIKTLGIPTLATPTVTPSGTTAQAYGNITWAGGEKCTTRGFCWVTSAHPDDPTKLDSTHHENGTFDEGTYDLLVPTLAPSSSYKLRAYATNPSGDGYSSTITFTTLGPPLTPTNFAASSHYTTYVRCTWTKSVGATGYRVYRNGVDISGLLGDVSSFNDYSAAAAVLSPIWGQASEGVNISYVYLNLGITGPTPPTTYEYKVVAVNAYGTSSFSTVDSGCRIAGTETYQWQRSSGDAPSGYSNIIGATTVIYADYGAPADGSGRYYRCLKDASGCAQVISTSARGYRALPNVPAVHTITPTSITLSSCTGNGNVTSVGSTNVTRVGFYYLRGTSGTPTLSDSEVGINVNYGAPTSYQVPITGLVSGSGYRIRAYATNSIGTTLASEVIQIFTTFIPQISLIF